MKNWWIRFGCYLTGYNYGIIRGSSEVAAKAVKRYTSALLIVSIIWCFVGFSFTQRYLHSGLLGSMVGAALMVVIIIQIERQIILAVNPGNWLYVFRGLIAFLMALIGAGIIDQIIFKEDIELEKITFIEDRVKKALPPKTEELRYQIASLDTAIYKKEVERLGLIDAVNKEPVINIRSTQTNYIPVENSRTDSTGTTTRKQELIPKTTTQINQAANPKQDQILPLAQMIAALQNQRTEKENKLLNIRPQLEAEIKSKVGFLDELEVMYTLVTRSKVALTVWFIWFFFLMGLEMLVVVSKSKESKTDYDETIMHQMALQKKRLDLIAKHSKDPALTLVNNN